MITQPLSTDIQFTFEMLSDTNGALVAAPTELKLYVVRPGAVASEYVNTATFELLTDGIVRTTIPAAYSANSGVLVAFVLGSNCSSKSALIVQVGDTPAVGADLWVPFAGRKSTGEPRKGMTAGDVNIVITLASPTLRGVTATNFVCLQDLNSQNTMFYLTKVLYTEIDRSGALSYSIEGADLLTFSQTIFVGDPDSALVTIQLNPAYSGVNVAVLRAQGYGVAGRGVTDGSGEVKLTLARGDYIIRLSRSAWEFSTNNTAFEVVDSTTDFVQINAAYTADQPQASGFCRLYFTLLKPDGSPDAGVRVLFAPRLAALGGAFNGVNKQVMAVKTDGNGYGELNLISGLQVVVNVEGTRIYEELTVPNSSEANLFQLISFEDKGFESYVGNFDYGIRRTLNP